MSFKLVTVIVEWPKKEILYLEFDSKKFDELKFEHLYDVVSSKIGVSEYDIKLLLYIESGSKPLFGDRTFGQLHLNQVSLIQCQQIIWDEDEIYYYWDGYNDDDYSIHAICHRQKVLSFLYQTKIFYMPYLVDIIEQYFP